MSRCFLPGGPPLLVAPGLPRSWSRPEGHRPDLPRDPPVHRRGGRAPVYGAPARLGPGVVARDRRLPPLRGAWPVSRARRGGPVKRHPDGPAPRAAIPATGRNPVRAGRLLAILPGLDPLRGICPACDGLMDETGCRIGAHRAFRVSAGFTYREAPGWRGVKVGQLVEVFCTAPPVDRLEPCPCCETHPGVAPCPRA